ncbi:hypothetical protein EJB05_47040, partial [Eragrostis curvula]
MNVLLSAVASELAGRLVSFLIAKYLEASATNNDDTAVKLQRALLRARVVVEEAEGRQIANQAMLLQLRQLRRALCRGAYALDAFRWRVLGDPNRRRSLATVSRCRSCLEAALRDVRELVVLLDGCPRVARQPYSAYLFMERCMFGRQLEKEEIIGFCLSSQPSLQSHEHHRSLVDVTESARSLMVIDMVDDSDADAEESWKSWFHSARAHGGSKIIVISRTEAHLSLLGTCRHPLRLLPPRREELWYFFRALAFGSADPDDRPELARIAMALCDGIYDFAMYVAANTIAASLRADLTTRSWRRVHKVYAEATSLQLGDGLDEYYMCRPIKGAPGAPCLFSNRRKLIGRNELPVVTMLDLLAGGCVPPAGATRFDVLVWQSPIPPYGCYVATCDMERARQVVAREKRARKRRRDRHDNG